MESSDQSRVDSALVEAAEQKRLDVLYSYHLLDASIADEYANVVALAANILGVPDGYVTLLDHDRQWIKAAVNPDCIGSGPMEDSFCRHMINTHQPMVVEDASLHEIFKAYENVTGSPYIRFYAGVPLEAPEGEVLGALCVTDSKPRQISEEQIRVLQILAKQVQNQMELRRTSIRLQAALLEAEEARKSRDLFFASVSHDIRTPAAAIVGASHILSHEKLPDNALKLVEGIEIQGKLLTLLINNLLDLAKLDAGKFELVKSTFDLSTLVREVIEGQNPVARGKNIDLCWSYAPELGTTVVGDPLRLRQILGNLISNAIKFTSEGSVVLSASKSETGILLTVTDTGIGIPADRLDAVLHEYEQADTHTQSKYGGTGLGLSIVSKLTALMNGKLTIASEIGKGSAFAVDLPLEEVRLSDLDREIKRALIVDDNEINQLVAESILSDLKIQTDVAGSIAKAKVLITEHHYDLVLLDEHLPDGRGTDLAKIIRENPNNSQVIVLGISASVEESDVQSYHAAGMNGYMSKPFTVGQLQTALRSAQGNSEQD